MSPTSPFLLIAVAFLVACSEGRPAVSSNPAPAETSTPERTTGSGGDLEDRKISFMWKWGIYISKADGSERRLVAKVPEAYGGQHWSSAANAFITRVEKNRKLGPALGLIYKATMSGRVVNLSSRNGGTTDAMVGWAPDGRHIVFTSTRKADRYPQLYVMGSDGRDVRRLVKTDFEAQYPQWSPDGETIAFTGVIDGNFELFTVSSDGQNLTRLTETPDSENWPTWSPDSSQIAFLRNEEIWASNPDGSDAYLVTVPDDASGGEPNWSPDGELITFDCGIDDPGICVIRPDGTGFTRIFGKAAFPYWIK